jgi:hypothetical protein
LRRSLQSGSRPVDAEGDLQVDAPLGGLAVLAPDAEVGDVRAADAVDAPAGVLQRGADRVVEADAAGADELG